jgi:hypothetical protein
MTNDAMTKEIQNPNQQKIAKIAKEEVEVISAATLEDLTLSKNESIIFGRLIEWQEASNRSTFRIGGRRVWASLIFLLMGCHLALAAAPPMILNSRPATAGLIDGRWAGMKCDGTNDDSAAFRTAVSWVTNNGVLWWPGRALLKPSGTTPAATLDGLTNLTVLGAITNNDFSMTGGNWKTLSSLAATGMVAYATTATAHGYSGGQFLGIYCSGDTNYGGVIQVLTNGLDATHFAYNTLGGTPAGAGSGTMQATTLDFATPILDLTRLDHPHFYVKYEAPWIWRGVRHRLGRVLLRLNASGTNDNVDVSGELDLHGCTYGIWSGNYLDARFGHCLRPRFKITGSNVGYGAAFWGSGEGADLEIDLEDIHRGTFMAGAQRARVHGKVRNFDVAGAFFTSEYNGVLNLGPENIDVDIQDGGSTEGTSYFSGSARYLVNLALDPAGPTVVVNYQEINAKAFLKVGPGYGENIVAMGMTQQGQTNSQIDNVKFHWTIDRSAVTNSSGFGPSYELFARADGVVKRFILEDCSTLNSAATVTNQNCKRDINFPNIASDGYVVKRNLRTDSVATETLVGGFSTDGEGGFFINGSPTERRMRNPVTGALGFTIGANAITFNGTNGDWGSISQPMRMSYRRGDVMSIDTIAYAATMTIDFGINAAAWKAVTMTGDGAFVTSNLQAGRPMMVFIAADTSTRNFTAWPAWHWIGAAAGPASIAANKQGRLELRSEGTTDGSVQAEWSVEP